MTKENKQKILVEFVYNGMYYHGLSYQGDTTTTMLNTNLVPKKEFPEIQFIGRTNE